MPMTVCLRFQLADWGRADLLDLEAMDIIDACRSDASDTWRAKILNASGRVAGIETVADDGPHRAVVELLFDQAEDAARIRRKFKSRLGESLMGP
ncbi:hypothetical protein ACVIHH_002970 [Bradyrhizobium sp. USDA 4518]